MSEESENTLAGTKYEGKTAEDLARMHTELEGKLGEQGTELGALRESVNRLTAELSRREAAAAPADTGRTPKDRYKKYAEKLLLDPETVVPEMIEDIRSEIKGELAQGMGAAEHRRTVIEGFMRDNPEMMKVKEIFGEIGDRIARANPNADFRGVLDAAKKETSGYLQELRKRGVLVGGDATAPNKTAGITTSGGRARDTGPQASGETDEQPASGSESSILAEIKSLKSFRENRMGYRRAKQ